MLDVYVCGYPCSSAAMAGLVHSRGVDHNFLCLKHHASTTSLIEYSKGQVLCFEKERKRTLFAFRQLMKEDISPPTTIQTVAIGIRYICSECILSSC